MTSVRTGALPRSHRRPSRIGWGLAPAGSGVFRRDRRSCDPRDEEHGETHAQDLHEERPERPDREEERAQWRTDELVSHEEPGLQSCIAEPQVGGPHQHRKKGAARRVGEHLCRAVQEGRRQHDPHRDMTGDEEDHQAPDDHRAQAVRQHDEPPPVVVVGDGPRQQAEQQPRQELHHRAPGHQQRRRGQRGDQQRRGRQGDAVTDVARPRRRQQPTEVGAESAWSDQFAERGHCGVLEVLDRRGVPARVTPERSDRAIRGRAEKNTIPGVTPDSGALSVVTHPVVDEIPIVFRIEDRILDVGARESGDGLSASPTWRWW